MKQRTARNLHLFEPLKHRFESSSPIPASPRFPQCKQLFSHKSTDADSRDAQTSSQEPPPPMFWTWFCHLCRVHYSLGVTRRCLHEGRSVFCGRAVTKNGKTGHRSPCHMEFEYVRWRIWGRWNRHKKQIGSSQTYRERNFCINAISRPNASGRMACTTRMTMKWSSMMHGQL